MEKLLGQWRDAGAYGLAMSSNEFYGELNRRFDERAEWLHSLGFVRETVEALGVSVYVKRARAGRLMAIPAAVLSAACGRLWADKVEDVRRFVSWSCGSVGAA